MIVAIVVSHSPDHTQGTCCVSKGQYGRAVANTQVHLDKSARKTVPTLQTVRATLLNANAHVANVGRYRKLNSIDGRSLRCWLEDSATSTRPHWRTLLLSCFQTDFEGPLTVTDLIIRIRITNFHLMCAITTRYHWQVKTSRTVNTPSVWKKILPVTVSDEKLARTVRGNKEGVVLVPVEPRVSA